MKNENNVLVRENIQESEIKDLIYTIRGKQIMLDSDLAKLYGCKNGTKEINQAVKNNINKFPERFSWVLSDDENCYLKSKILTSNLIDNKRGGRRNNIRVFTEQGVAMLATIIKSKIATEISIKIMDAFVEMRKFLISNGIVFERLNNIEYKLIEHDKKFEEVFKEFETKENIKQRIFFEGQIYDAYSLIVSFIESAKENILIIDNYIDNSVLDMLSKKKENVKVKIMTSTSNSIKNIDIEKFNTEYPLLEIIRTNKFHDRFIIIDNEIIYHLGASIKDAGKKCFGINKIGDKELVNQIISYVK